MPICIPLYTIKSRVNCKGNLSAKKLPSRSSHNLRSEPIYPAMACHFYQNTRNQKDLTDILRWWGVDPSIF